jgi:hypothetical protein
MDCLGEKKNTWALYCGGNEIVLSNYASEFRRPELRKYPEEAFPLTELPPCGGSFVQQLLRETLAYGL